MLCFLFFAVPRFKNMTLLFVYLAIAIGVSFLCSILEAVLLSITPSYVEQVSTENPRSGVKLAKSKEKLDESLSSILILNTFAHTMGAAGVGSQAVILSEVEGSYAPSLRSLQGCRLLGQRRTQLPSDSAAGNRVV
jgi:CBS domain containing-hemolysin-like protein